MTKVKRPRGAMTGPEHDAWLKETGQYDAVIENQRKKEEEHAQYWAAVDAALEPLKEDLRTAGAPSLSALSSQTKPPNVYKAIPILLAHLQRTTYPREAHVSIAGYLSFPEVKPYWDLLLQLYRDERDESAKHELASAIIAATNEGKDNTNLDQVIALVRDKRHGVCRGLLLYLLEKTKDPRGRATMEELADDPDLAEQIGVSLKVLDRNAVKRAERQARKNPTRH